MQARWSINITPIERGARIVLGLLGVVGGEILLSQADSTGAVIVELLLIVAGLVLLQSWGSRKIDVKQLEPWASSPVVIFLETSSCGRCGDTAATG